MQERKGFKNDEYALLKKHHEIMHGNNTDKSSTKPKVSNEARAKKIFKCEKCNIKFNARTMLQDHLETVHKNYSCCKCGANFTDQRNYSMHFADQHQDLCDFCEESFPQAIRMKKHIAIAHPGMAGN